MGLFRRYFPSEYLFTKKLQIHREIEFFVVGKDEDKFICAMGIKKIEDTYRLLHIVTHPEYERQGIATALQYKALKFCKKEGALTIDVMKEEGGFFDNKKFGFNIAGSFITKKNKWIHYIWNKT